MARFFHLIYFIFNFTVLKIIAAIVFTLICGTGLAQQGLNKYKYIIVPKKFEHFNQPNQHQTSTLLKYAFAERGFLVIYDDEMPADLFQNRCLGLTALLKDNSSMFYTKVAVALLDCTGQEVFATLEARNRIKEYNKAYKAAILEAMTAFDGFDYTYVPVKADEKPITLNFKNDVKTLEEAPKATVSAISIPKDTAGIKPKNSNAMVSQTATQTDQSYKSREPIGSTITKSSKEPPTSGLGENKGATVLYAQAIANGYQLVDSTPKVVLKLMKSSSDNVFMATGDGKSGMVFQNGDIWVFEYYLGEELVRDELSIKF